MRRFLALAMVALVALVVAGVGNAGREQQTLTCEGLGTITVTVTTTTNHSVAWGVGTVSSSLHGIPVSFSGTITDLTTNTVLDTFFQAKGKGNGMHNQPTVTCTSPPETAKAGELGIPGTAVPGGGEERRWPDRGAVGADGCGSEGDGDDHHDYGDNHHDAAACDQP
jgi:hypothetical protein